MQKHFPGIQGFVRDLVPETEEISEVKSISEMCILTPAAASQERVLVISIIPLDKLSQNHTQNQQ